MSAPGTHSSKYGNHSTFSFPRTPTSSIEQTNRERQNRLAQSYSITKKCIDVFTHFTNICENTADTP